MKRGLQTIHRGRSHALALLLAAAACGGGDGSEPAVTTAQASQRAAATARAKSITLITGDRITMREVAGQLAPLVEPGPGRLRISFSIEKSDGEVRVVPSDVVDLIAKGALDPELFHVTRLLAEGYGDAERNDTPLLITGLARGASGADAADAADAATAFAQVRGAFAAAGLTVAHESPRLGMMAVRQRKDGAGAQASLASLRSLTSPTPGLTATGAAGAHVKLWLDPRHQISLAHSVPQIGAPAAYARGWSGAGVKIAVIDTGVDATHPDLAGKVVASATFVDDERGPEDAFGHGTHVASIAAGGATSGPAARYHGVAPGAQIINARVCDEGGGCYSSAIIAGMEWAVAQGARVVNVSLGGTDYPGIDPLEEAVNTLSRDSQVLFVVSAGNSGALPVSSPASADEALAVGAVDESDQRATFSSIGPRVGDLALKPDLTAPGVGIIAARAAGTELGDPIDEHYTQLSGTSMAAPHVAGAAALLLQQHPSWSQAELKAALMASAQPTGGMTVYQQGAGRVDVDRATAQTIAAAPGSLSFAVSPFPHDDDEVQTRTVRYRNDGATAVTLSLAATLALAGGETPAGLISVTPSTLQLPAGGSAEAVVRIDTRGALPPGSYGGALVASAGEARLLTPIGATIEGEVHDLKVRILDAQGRPSSSYVSVRGLGPVGTPARAFYQRGVYVQGASTFRVPVGTYTVAADGGGAFLVAPRVTVAADAAVDMDRRVATEQKLVLPEPGFALDNAFWEYVDVGNQYLRMMIAFRLDFRTGEIGDPAPAGEIHSSHHFVFARPADDDDDGDAMIPARAEVYHLARSVPDHFTSGWQQTFQAKDFAHVNATYSMAPGLLGRPVTFALAPLPTFPASSAPVPEHAPFHRKEHYFGDGYLWNIEAEEIEPFPDFPDDGYFVAVNEAIRAFSAGRTYEPRWNRAPFGPAFFERSRFSTLPGHYGAPLQTAHAIWVQPSLTCGQMTPTPYGMTSADDGHARLYRNGELIGEAGGYGGNWAVKAPIPPGAADFRFDTSVTRPSQLFDLSTYVAATWTFRATGNAGEQVLPLPFLRFSPELDLHNRSAAPVMILPIHIARPVGAATPRIAEANIEISFDDGATWRRLPILRLGDRAVAAVVHPRDAAYVSLRGSARDVEGNRVEQTIVRAYGLRR